MHKLMSLALVLIFLIGANQAFSGPVKGPTKIDKIRIRAGVTYVMFTGCERYALIYLNTEYGKAMFSSALTAATADKNVTVQFEDAAGCGTESQLTYLEVDF
ncbi:MAG: hypothetical protein RPR97_12790 [Colwellia sp.]